ncbi:MAG: transglycosylase domain-containing protein [Lachnospiraceae bacterium]|nr:transglycosylase domain-containing protein [Lachnospiraceae bacterium]
MNYSKNGLKQKQKQMNSKSEKFGRKVFINICKIFLVLAVSGVIIGGSAALGAFKGCIDTAPEISSSDVAPEGFSTFVYDKDGNQITKLVASNSNRISVTLDKVPLYLQKAFIAIEDSSFYEHNGIDIIGIIRAGVTGVLNGFNFRSGASTITQQLIKNTIYEDFVNESKLEKIERKIQEWYLAIQISNELSKNEVLIRYLNTINLGQNTLGVQSAAHRYFGKDVSELNLSECAVIAAITKSPTGYNPITNPEANQKRRLNVLDEMLELEYITKAEYDEALKDDPYTRIAEVNQTYVASDNVTTYFIDAVTDQVYNDLLEAGYTEKQAENLIYRSGLKINTTLDMEIQSIVDEVCSDESNFPRAYWQLGYQLSIDKANGETIHHSTEMMQKYLKDTKYTENGYSSSDKMLFKSEEAANAAIEYYKAYAVQQGDVILGEKISLSLQPQLSVVILDQQTGYVRALLGGRGEKTVSKAFNRATDATRQPGSCFKVLAAYVPAIDSGMYTLATVQNDAPFAYTNSGDGNDRLVQNWHEKTQGYKGLLNYREGIRNSRNVITVKAMTLVTPQVGMDYLLNFGFTTLLSSTSASGHTDVNQSLCLGGITHGVTNLEMTAAYAAIANGGKYIEPTLYTTVLDKNGNVILDKSDNRSTRIMRETTAWLITDAMQDVVTEGTGTTAKVVDMTVSGKTGTTTDSMDVWFSGYTPYYTGSIWLGFDENNATLNKAEESTHTKIWSKIMTLVHEGLEDKEIMEKPENIIEVEVCSKSGKLPTPGLCDAHIYKEYFVEGTEPIESCDVHVYGFVCETDGVMSTMYCPYKIEGSIEQVPVEHELLQPGSRLGALLYSLGENTEDVDIEALLPTVQIKTSNTCHHTFEYMLEHHWDGDPANGGFGYPDDWLWPSIESTE